MALFVPSPEVSRVFCNPNSSSNPISMHRKPRSVKIDANNKKVGSCTRIRVLSETGDYKITVSHCSQNVMYGKFSAPVKPGSKQSKEEEKQNYYVNMGYAIRTLREELPEIFHRELSFDIYRYVFLRLCGILYSVCVCLVKK